MPISQIVPNTIEVRTLGVIANQLAINVFHAIAGSAVVNQALANTLGAAIKAAWTANLGALCPSQTSLVRVGVRDLRVEHGPEFLDAGAAVVGTGVGDVLPGQVALCLTLRTAQAGKSFRGRTYLGGFMETQNDASGFATQATQTAAVAYMTAVSNALTGSQLTLAVTTRPAERVVVTRTTFHNDGTTTVKTLSQQTAKPGNSTPITLIQSRNGYWETQRRRSNTRGAPPALLSSEISSHL